MEITKRRLDTLTKDEFIEAFNELNKRKRQRFLLQDIAMIALNYKNISKELYDELQKHVV